MGFYEWTLECGCRVGQGTYHVYGDPIDPVTYCGNHSLENPNPKLIQSHYYFQVRKKAYEYAGPTDPYANPPPDTYNDFTPSTSSTSSTATGVTTVQDHVELTSHGGAVDVIDRHRSCSGTSDARGALDVHCVNPSTM